MEKDIEHHPIAYLDNTYPLQKKIGMGSTSKVYLGEDPKDKKNYSFKILKADSSLVKKEIDVLSSIDHPNVLKIIKHGTGLLKKKTNPKPKEVYYIITEHIANGELFDYIKVGKGFGENYARIIFIQILEALQSVHSLGIVHRDIKLDNIMLDSEFNVKLVDFGFATNQHGNLSTFQGTPNYASPQILVHKPYNGVSNDIFSLGVTLFALITGAFPFQLAVAEDKHYRYIAKNDYRSYWMTRGVKVSKSFMELFNMMVALDETQRPSLEEIKTCAWIKEVNYEYLPMLKEEFKRRLKIISSQKNDLLQEKSKAINEALKKYK